MNHASKKNVFPATDLWLVLLTILKNISQWEGLSHIILWTIKKFSKPPATSPFLDDFPLTGARQRVCFHYCTSHTLW